MFLHKFYYRRDHLGSNVAVWDATADSTVQRTLYYASGLPMRESKGQEVQTRKYNGKEYHEIYGLNEYDYGFRGYYATIGRFSTIDPLAEKYPHISPYAYCANNPILFIDPNGKEIREEDKEEWEKRKKEIQQRYEQLKDAINELDGRDDMAEQLDDAEQRLPILKKTIKTMGKLEKSNQIYGLTRTPDHEGETYLDVQTGVIMIGYSGETAIFVHEVTHAGQFESGEIGFNGQTGELLAYDTYDEVAAYKAQYAYDPGSFKGLNPLIAVNSMSDINSLWVQGIEKNGIKIYAPGSNKYIGEKRVNINSRSRKLQQSYPWRKDEFTAIKSLKFVSTTYYRR